jgi:cytochrome c oxidase subunit 1
MPRRYHTYDGEFSPYHIASTIGSWILAAGFIWSIIILVKAFFSKTAPKAPLNPWGGTTLEWTAGSPPIHTNFEETPIVEGRPYEYR